MEEEEKRLLKTIKIAESELKTVEERYEKLEQNTTDEYTIMELRKRI